MLSQTAVFPEDFAALSDAGYRAVFLTSDRISFVFNFRAHAHSQHHKNMLRSPMALQDIDNCSCQDAITGNQLFLQFF